MKTTAEKSTHSKPTTSHHGQEAVGHFIPPTVQPKLTVNSPDDPLEREADTMASQVVTGEATTQLQDGNNLRRKEMAEAETVQRQVGEEEEEMVQRQCTDCEEEEETVQRQVSEEEEEVVQLQVSEEEKEVVQLQVSEEEEEEMVQRQCADCEEEEETVQRQASEEEEEETVQRTSAGSAGGQSAPPIVGAVVRSAGRPLDTTTRRSMEGSFGADFSGVRVHHDQQAQQSARAISAQAYTYGNHIAFAPGKYEPHTQRGQHLLAHELTHVVQQGEGVQRRVENGNANTTTPSTPGTATNATPAGSATNAPAPLPPATGPAPIQPEVAGTAPQAPAAPPAAAPEVLPAASPEPAAAAPLEPLMPPPPETLGPAARSRLSNAQQNAGTAAAANADLPTAEDLTQEARGGVTEPTAETDARASGALAASLSERLAPSPEILELCANIRRIIRERRPPDEESLTSADPEAAANAAGSELNDSIDADVERVEGDYDELDENPTGTPEQVGETVETPPAEVAEPAIGAAGATPDPLTAEDVSLDADAANSAQQMADAGMSTPVAAEIQDGPVAEARATQQELEESAAIDPAIVLAEQDAALMSSRADMEALQARALQALENSRAGSVAATGTQQQDLVSSEVDQREVLGERAETIFTDAQNQVNTLLEPLTRTAMEMWDNGKERIATEFEQHLARVQSWIDDRHSGFGGGLTELWDDLTGLPDWVTDEYNDAERDFGDSVCDLIQEISLFVNGVIVTCEELIDTANQQIDEIFTNAGPELAEWAATQREQFQGRLDGLREQVSTTQQDFNRDLTDRAAQAVQEVREQVHALREAARGLLGQIANAIAEFLDDPIRAIINGLLRLVGIDPAAFWALAARIEQVISDIANDPLGFASNLLAAIGAGFDLFFDNFFTHLFEGFIQWIFSGLGAVGVEIPADFSLGSIITFFLQLMGITWERIRMLLARHIGEENVALLEQAYTIITDLIELGPAGVFELIKEQLDPQQILDQVIQMAVDFVIETLVTQATIRIALLFNPVGAIAQAIEAIYKILKWIFQNAARIFTLVESVVNGMADIIAGNIAGMAATVENALARLLVPVIDFVAEFMSLGGLPERVADMVRGLQAWVEGILDRVIGWLAGQARAILSALGISEDADPEAEGEAAGGELEDSEVGASINFQAGGEQHRLWVNASGGQVELMVASDTPMSVAARLTQWEGRVSELADADQGRARSLIGVVRSQYEHVKDEGEQAQHALDEAQTDPSAEAIAHAQQEDTQVEQAEQAMTDELGALFDLFEGGVPDPEWLDLRRTFTTTDEEPHSIYFERNGEEIDLIRASDLPTEILTYLNTLTYEDDDPRKASLSRAKAVAGEIKLLTRTPTTGQTATTAAEESTIVPKISELSQLLITLVEDEDTTVALPPTADWSQRLNNPPSAHYSRVYLLSSLTASGGGGASGTSPEYEFTVGQGWVRMHLIPYSVGGFGGPDNWVAAPSNVNSGGPVRSFETGLETLVRSQAIPPGPGRRERGAEPVQPSVVWVETEVTGYRPAFTDNMNRDLHFASGVEMQYGLYRPEGGNWVKVAAPVSRQNVGIPPPADNRIRLSSASGTAMGNSGLPHLSNPRYGGRLITLIKQVRQAGFGSYDILEARLLAVTLNSRLFTPELIETIVEDFRNNPNIVLR
ncbi:MAG: hypothetical protein DA408_06825 [Bacteroidetes bacterium]|nr:MAG: hypothetical protein DA408_06825 [Bacteroidota bacterium]